MIRLGSAFSGIGGFELGLHWAIPNLETLWQIEKDAYCQQVLKKHWPKSHIYSDITTIKTNKLQDIDILCAGFPCQDLSVAGKKEGINGKKSGLFWELWTLIRDFKEQGRAIPIILLENVPAITSNGLGHVLGALSEIGYNAEWFVISAGAFGAPHLRKRWFLVAYSNSKNNQKHPKHPRCVETTRRFKRGDSQNVGIHQGNYWKEQTPPPALCSVDDGISHRMAKIRALGNAIVPQCSHWIGQRMIESGLLEDMLC